MIKLNKIKQQTVRVLRLKLFQHYKNRVLTFLQDFKINNHASDTIFCIEKTFTFDKCNVVSGFLTNRKRKSFLFKQIKEYKMSQRNIVVDEIKIHGFFQQ